MNIDLDLSGDAQVLLDQILAKGCENEVLAGLLARQMDEHPPAQPGTRARSSWVGKSRLVIETALETASRPGVVITGTLLVGEFVGEAVVMTGQSLGWGYGR